MRRSGKFGNAAFMRQRGVKARVAGLRKPKCELLPPKEEREEPDQAVVLSRKSAMCKTATCAPALRRPAWICRRHPGLEVTTVCAPVFKMFSIFRACRRSAISGSVKL